MFHLKMGEQYVCPGRFRFKEKENREKGVGDKMDWEGTLFVSAKNYQSRTI